MALGLRPRAVLKTTGTVLPYTDRPKQVNNIYISDQYSKFPVIRKLTSTTSQAIATNLKSICCRTRHPCPISSRQRTTIQWKGIQRFHKILCCRTPCKLPTLSRGKRVLWTHGTNNGKQKEEMDDEGGDPYLGLLSYRATPIDHHLNSPAELLTALHQYKSRQRLRHQRHHLRKRCYPQAQLVTQVQL